MTDTEIIKQLGFENMPQAFQDQALELAHNTVEMQVMGTFDDLLTDEQRAEFDSKVAQVGKEQAMQWLSSEVADVDQLYDAMMQDYIKETNSGN